MKFGADVGNGVGSFDSGGAGMIVVEVPGDELAIGSDCAFYFDYACGAEVSPGEFFFACPNNFDRPVRGAGEARGFYRGVTGVLATVGGAGVGDDYADGDFGSVKRGGQFAVA